MAVKRPRLDEQLTQELEKARNASRVKPSFDSFVNEALWEWLRTFTDGNPAKERTNFSPPAEVLTNLIASDLFMGEEAKWQAAVDDATAWLRQVP